MEQIMADKIKDAYRCSKNIYDDVLTKGSFLSRLYIDLFWSGTDDNQIAKILMDYIPDDFKGKLLDVPVGTAVFTYRKWNALKDAEIICLDYSSDMIDQAGKRLDDHVSCVQGDVGDLPFEDGSFDMVLSMNGFHAFPDKLRAYEEICRVLKKDGIFIGCFYIKGKSKITDWLVGNILSKKGWFTPPFQSEEDVKDTLNRYYKDIEIHTDGSIVYFRCHASCDEKMHLKDRK